MEKKSEKIQEIQQDKKVLEGVRYHVMKFKQSIIQRKEQENAKEIRENLLKNV